MKKLILARTFTAFYFNFTVILITFLNQSIVSFGLLSNGISFYSEIKLKCKIIFDFSCSDIYNSINSEKITIVLIKKKNFLQLYYKTVHEKHKSHQTQIPKSNYSFNFRCSEILFD